METRKELWVNFDLDQESLGIIFKDADPRVVGPIHDSRQGRLPWGNPGGQEHDINGGV